MTFGAAMDDFGWHKSWTATIVDMTNSVVVNQWCHKHITIEHEADEIAKNFFV